MLAERFPVLSLKGRLEQSGSSFYPMETLSLHAQDPLVLHQRYIQSTESH